MNTKVMREQDKKDFVQAIRAMDFLARCVNNEEDLTGWLMCGVPDGDITESTTDEEILEMYDADDMVSFIGCFLRTMRRAAKDNEEHGLYIAGIVADIED